MLAASGDRVFLDGRHGPGQVAVGVNLGIVIHGQLDAFVPLQQFGHTRLVLRPVAIPKRRDIEESVFALVVILSHVGWISRAPPRHEFLKIGFVWRAGRGSLFLRLGCRKAGKTECENAD